MSWYPDLHIGELRPWPDAVYVWRGQTGESQRYLPDDFCALARENNELRTERDTYRDLVGMMDHPDLNVQLSADNTKLRELVRDMWRGAMGRMDYAERYAFAGEFVDRMRELEVDA